MEIVSGVVAAKSASGICIDDVWYGDFKGMKTRAINKGDFVSLTWEPDKKTGKYKNIVTVGKSPTTGSSPAAPSVERTYTSTKSTVGIELGHASKLAMDLTIAISSSGDASFNMGDDDFYKAFINHTDKIYRIMSALRKKKEVELSGHKDPVEAYKDKEPLLAAEAPAEEDPLF